MSPCCPHRTGPDRVDRRGSLQRLAAAALAGLLPGAVAADPGAVVLTITGQVTRPNAGADAAFTMDALARLPQTSFTTRTPWYAEPRRFTGPLLRDVLAAAGARGRTLRASALNDYRVEIPFEDAQVHELIVARLLDDQPMAVRNKGPLFLIYPFDARPALRTATYYARSVWQLRTIEVI